MKYFGEIMTLTNFNEFKKMFKRIPKERLPFVRFIPLRQDSKNPLRRGSWKLINLTYYEIKKDMNMGVNIAVVCLPKGVMVWDFDIDETGKLYEPELAKELLQIKTLTVETRSKGLHFYFLNDGKYNTQDRIINNNNVGELRANWSYVVGAGSWVDLHGGHEGQYRVVQDEPILSLPEKYKDFFKEGDTTTTENNILAGKKGKPISEKTLKIMIAAGMVSIHGRWVRL